MLVMETFARSVERGKAIKAICRELGLSRKVVRKVIRSGATEFHYGVRCRHLLDRISGITKGATVFLVKREIGCHGRLSRRIALRIITSFQATERKELGFTGSDEPVVKAFEGWV